MCCAIELPHAAVVHPFRRQLLQSSSQRGFYFLPELILSMAVSAGKTKRHKPGNAGAPCNRPCLRGGEMAPFGSNLCVLVQEGRLDEELVGTARQLDNSFDIRLMESGVDHVGNLISTRCAQRMLLEQAEGDK